MNIAAIDSTLKIDRIAVQTKNTGRALRQQSFLRYSVKFRENLWIFFFEFSKEIHLRSDLSYMKIPRKIFIIFLRNKHCIGGNVKIWEYWYGVQQ